VTANKRSSVLPNVPTMQESGLKDFDFLFWGAIYAPAGTPDDIVQKLSVTIGEMMRDEKVVKRLKDVGNEPIGSTPAELDKYWKSEIELYRRIVTDAGIKLADDVNIGVPRRQRFGEIVARPAAPVTLLVCESGVPPV